MPPRSRRRRGYVEQLPSGSYRAVVYAGIDPLTRRYTYVRETRKTRAEAEKELTRLQRDVDLDRQTKSAITIAEAIDQWMAVAELEETTRDRYEDLIRLYIGPTFGDLKVGKLNAELLEIGDEFGGDAPAGLAGGIPRPHEGQQGLGLGGGQVLLRATRDELEQQVVQLGHHPGVVLAQGAAPVGQDPQHRQLGVVDHRAQPAHPGTDQGDGVRVGSVGLAALTSDEHPRPRGQFRWHVHDLLAIGEQPGGDVSADAGAASIAHTRAGHAAT